MTSLLDSIIVGTTLLGSVGAAFMMQKTALDLFFGLSIAGGRRPPS